MGEGASLFFEFRDTFGGSDRRMNHRGMDNNRYLLYPPNGNLRIADQISGVRLTPYRRRSAVLVATPGVRRCGVRFEERTHPDYWCAYCTSACGSVSIPHPEGGGGEKER